MRRSFRVSVDGNTPARTRYFIDGSEVDQDFYIAEFYQDYGTVPSDANISLTARQEVDQAGQTTENIPSIDDSAIVAVDVSNPGGVTTLPATQLN